MMFRKKDPSQQPPPKPASGGPDYARAQVDLMRHFVEDGRDGPLWAARMIGLRGKWISSGQAGFDSLTVFLDEVHDDLINYGELDEAREPGEYDHAQIRAVMRQRLAELERRELLP